MTLGLIRPAALVIWGPMQIVLNGQARDFSLEPGRATLEELVAVLGMKPDRIAIERNGDIAPRARWEQTPLAEGDRLEIVHFVGGGL